MVYQPGKPLKFNYTMKYFLTTLFSLLFITAVEGQAHVTSSGISVQGIARDANNSALLNLNALSLDFVIYYLNGANTEEIIHQESGDVSTDGFGVFSYVVNISNTNFVKISNKESYLKVSQGSAIFSNEKLHTVPYAIHAQNGVPTGSIMPFVGNSSNVPEGWLLCDGASFTDDAYHAKLKSLLGSVNTPNLSGTYLRGTGTSGDHVGPSLNAFQQDQNKEHLHAVSLTGSTSIDGQHKHNLGAEVGSFLGGPYPIWGNATNAASDWVEPDDKMLENSQHGHSVTLSGNTGNSGSAEARVYGYGVNYIIKI